MRSISVSVMVIACSAIYPGHELNYIFSAFSEPLTYCYLICFSRMYNKLQMKEFWNLSLASSLFVAFLLYLGQVCVDVNLTMFSSCKQQSITFPSHRSVQRSQFPSNLGDGAFNKHLSSYRNWSHIGYVECSAHAQMLPEARFVHQSNW
jgi:hypothetical protein